MSVDLIILDDEPAPREMVSIYAERAGLSYEVFDNGDGAVAYLNSLSPDEFPIGCVSDMSLLLDRIRDNPEKIGYMFAERGLSDTFLYMTGTVSKPDEGIAERTGMEVVSKGEALQDRIEGFLAYVVERKQA